MVSKKESRAYPYEQEIRDSLADRVGGITELTVYWTHPDGHQVVIGIIDVVTSKAIWEVKYYKGWKHALGQVLSYGVALPTLGKYLYLWGNPTISEKTMIETACLIHQVKVQWDSRYTHTNTYPKQNRRS